MATLVLTTIGGLAGGPIGAAIGAAIGQVADRAVLLKPKGRQGPRLTELAVQTSSYGRPIPRLFGRMRVAGQVIWATDLVEQRGRQGGGKGQPSMTTYTYSASFAVALSARPIQSIGRIWADGNLLRGAAGDWKVKTGFRLHRGSEDQAPDPLMASAEGIGSTPAHRGTAYVVFEDLPLETFGNRIPSLTFEVIADQGPITVGAMASEIAGGVIVGDGPDVTVDGFSAYGDSARGVIETLAEVSGAWFVPAGGGLSMQAAGASTRAIVDEAMSRQIAPAGRVPASVMVTHYDPDRDWQSGVQRAVRPGAAGPALMMEAPIAVAAGAAKQMAEGMLARAESARFTRRVAADLSALDVIPGSIVSIAGEGGAWRVTGVTVEQHRMIIALVALAPPPLPARASGGRVLRAPDERAGATILHAVEIPIPGDAPQSQTRITIVAAGEGAGWRRAALQFSIDGGESWQAAGGTAAAATLGEVVTGIAGGTSTLIDRRGAIDIVLMHSRAQLSNADPRSLDQGANLALIGNELIQFGRAERLGERGWRLSELWRGRWGTAVDPIAPGSRFALLEPACSAVLPVAAEQGQDVLVLAQGVDDAAPVEATVRVTGASLLPPAPVRVQARNVDPGLEVSWRRRTRADWRWRDGVDAALGEERESYLVTATRSDGSRRSFEIDRPVALLLPDSNPAPLASVAVRQRGTHGWSPATILIL